MDGFYSCIEQGFEVRTSSSSYWKLFSGGILHWFTITDGKPVFGVYHRYLCSSHGRPCLASNEEHGTAGGEERQDMKKIVRGIDYGEIS